MKKQFLFFVFYLSSINAKETEEPNDGSLKYYNQDERYCDVSNNDNGAKNKPGCNGVSTSF